VPEDTTEIATDGAMDVAPELPTDEFVEPVAQADGDGSSAAEDSTVPKKEFDTIKDSGEVS
jgi:hypothetical protein